MIANTVLCIQDSRDHIFLDNEEYREAETRQQGDTLFNELEERIMNALQVLPLPIPPFIQEPDHTYSHVGCGLPTCF